MSEPVIEPIEVEPAPERKVISIRTRDVYVPDQVTAEEIAQQMEEERLAGIEADLRVIDEFRAAVEKGDVTGIVLLGRHLPTGLFMTDMPVNFRFQPEKYEGLSAMLYAAHFDEMRNEMQARAALMPILVNDGDGNVEVIDEFTAQEFYPEDEE